MLQARVNERFEEPNVAQHDPTLKGNPERWVDEHADCLYRYAVTRLRDTSAAEDVVQETLMAGLQAWKNFAGQSSERTWLIGILKHKIVDHIRKRSRELPLFESDGGNDPNDKLFHENGHWGSEGAPVEWASNPETLLQQKEFREKLQQCLDTMPKRLAQAFILREMEGLETEEICGILNISSTNLWVMLHRARAHLRQYLELNYFRKK